MHHHSPSSRLLSALTFAPLGTDSCLIHRHPPSTGPHLSAPPPPPTPSSSSLSSPILSWTSLLPPALLHSPHRSPLLVSHPAVRTLGGWVWRGVGCAELATSDSCDAPLGGHRQSRLVFSPPVSSVFCLFISPAHRALNVFRCPAFFFLRKTDEGVIINLAA